MRPARLVMFVLLSLLTVGACTSASAGWTYTPAPPATPVPSTEPSAAPSAGGSAAPSGSAAGSAAPSAGSASVDDRGAGHRLHHAGRDGPRRDRPSSSSSTTRTRPSRTTSQIKDGTGAQVFKGDIFPGVEKRSYDVPRPDRRHVPLRLHRPPEHDRHADGAVGRGGRWARPESSSATRTRTLRTVEARVVAVESGDAPPGRPRSDGLLPGWRWPAIGSRVAASRGRWPVVDRACRPQGRRRDRPRARAGRRGPAGRRRRPPGRPGLGAPAGPDADPHRAPRPVRRRLARPRRPGHRRQHGARLGTDGLRVRADERAISSTRSRRPSTRSWPPTATSGSTSCHGSEAFAIPDLIRTKINLLPEGIEEIRTIEIVGLDLQADGGTHVANTREVGGDPGDRLRVQGPDQQAHPHRAAPTRVAPA